MPGITFTNATINTSATYLYVQSTDAFLGSPLSLNNFANTDFIASDAEFAPPNFYRTLNPQDVFGLARVLYTVAANASGTDALSIVGVGSSTTLTQVDGTMIPFTVADGAISTSSVPEPSALIQGITAVLIGLGVVWGRRRL